MKTLFNRNELPVHVTVGENESKGGLLLLRFKDKATHPAVHITRTRTPLYAHADHAPRHHRLFTETDRWKIPAFIKGSLNIEPTRPFPELNTPGSLRWKMYRTKAGSDINIVIHFTLLSYLRNL
ncbi:hypothetical protein CEXT_678141 [Caerostris extrusa]|uniref:Uncharacterized protein n=1 Tax=Caerostris extrusa TaxID=172846 RepID=A0AAV4TD99_CAEEX|nr:hypothetical protein CEXT_678141 [Caerostris extrusa]